jgi:hypothetical protein
VDWRAGSGSRQVGGPAGRWPVCWQAAGMAGGSLMGWRAVAWWGSGLAGLQGSVLVGWWACRQKINVLLLPLLIVTFFPCSYFPLSSLAEKAL